MPEMDKHANSLVVAFLLTAALYTPIAQARLFARRLGKPIYKKNSLYNNIFVHKRGTILTLKFGIRTRVEVQSQVDIRNLNHHMLEYTPMTFCGLLYNPEPKRILVLGLGGGVIPRQMRHHYPDVIIDVVEIDPEILKVAAKYFKFKEDDNLKVHIEDGRTFVRKWLRDKGPKYDMIILDAFNSEYIPYHLMTREFIIQLDAVLTDDGVIVANVFYPDRLFEAELATFMATLGPCQVYLGIDSDNAMIVAAPKMLTIPQAIAQARILQPKHRFSFNILTVAKKLKPNIHPPDSAIVLTDDRAPVNWLRSQPKK